MMDVRPTADGLLVEVIPDAERSPGGIIYVKDKDKPPQLGLVLAVGPGRIDKRGNLVPMEIKVGDKVIYERFRGTGVPPTEINEPERRLLHEADVYGVYTD